MKNSAFTVRYDRRRDVGKWRRGVTEKAYNDVLHLSTQKNNDLIAMKNNQTWKKKTKQPWHFFLTATCRGNEGWTDGLQGDINGHSWPGVIVLTFSYTLRFTLSQGGLEGENDKSREERRYNLHDGKCHFDQPNWPLSLKMLSRHFYSILNFLSLIPQFRTEVRSVFMQISTLYELWLL